MKSETKGILLPMLGAGVWSAAAHASIPMISCSDCTPVQEEEKTMLANGSGFVFVHNPDKSRVRKFELYFDVNGEGEKSGTQRLGGPDGVEVAAYAIAPDPEDADRVTIGDRVGADYAGWRRVLVEYPVDSDVARIAGVLEATEKELKGVNYSGEFGARVEIRMDALGVSEATFMPFDPREIAWATKHEAAEREFTERLAAMVATREGANRLNPLLGKVFYDIRDAAKAARIDIGPAVETGLTIQGLSTLTLLQVCDDQQRCVRARVDRETLPAKVEFKFAIDRYDVSFGRGDAPFTLVWGSWNGGGEGAREYADWLRKTKNVPVEVLAHADDDPRYQLTCMTKNGKPPLRCLFHTPRGASANGRTNAVSTPR